MNAIREMVAGVTRRCYHCMKKLTTKESVLYRGLCTCMEECAELIQAISKLKRYNPEDPNNKVSRNELIENLLEEMADVQICFNLLVAIYELKPSDLRRMIDHKVWRMKQKMESQGAKI